MHTRNAFIAAAVLGLASASPLASLGVVPKAPPDTPSAVEQAFVTRATSELQDRYGTIDRAYANGYFRYSYEDKSGAISWINTRYWTSDELHPSQLWYDAKGRLIGVDYTLPFTDLKHPPSKWGIISSRWSETTPHVHYGIVTPEQGLRYGHLHLFDFKKAWGDFYNPSALVVVNAGKAPSVNDVAFVFLFRHVWELEFWLIPNPKGAFAFMNPNVHPTAGTQPHN